MIATTLIDMVEMLNRLSCDGRTEIFSDSYFCRCKANLKADSFVDVVVTADCMAEHGVECFFISLHSTRDRQVDFTFADSQVSCYQEGRLIRDKGQLRLFWLPAAGARREYDDQGRMVVNVESDFEIRSDSSGLCLRAQCRAGSVFEFVVLCFRKRIEVFSRELTDLSPVETKRVVRDTWFSYEGMSDVWDYLINGMIYSTKHVGPGKAWNSQNLAYGLYYYLDYLLKVTGKRIYLICRNLVAYSVMLSLPNDGRWRHGIWTDLMETHMIHQVAGIDVLLSFHKETGNMLFMRKALAAADYLLSCTDRLDDGKVWFLHDSLEDNVQEARFYYEGMTPTAAFGKSPSNTLCLNSHILALAVLHRVGQTVHDEKYGSAFGKGLDSLRRLLGESPCSIVYGIIYQLRDWLLRCVLETDYKIIRKIQQRYDHVLRKSILPRLKRKHPRYVMPNGYIERDLCFAPLSDSYHLLNIKVLLMLYGVSPADWLLAVIRKGVEYTVKSQLGKFIALYGSRAVVLLDILLMYSAMVDETYLGLLSDYLKYFVKLDMHPQVDILADPQIANVSAALWADSHDVLILAPACSAKFVAVIVNLADSDIRMTIHATGRLEIQGLEIVDLDNRKYVFDQVISVPREGYLKVVKRNGKN